MPRIHNSHRKQQSKRAAAATKTARKLPRQERSRVMVEMLMRAATRILIREGYEALNTNRVAEEAGASVGSLYQYFSSKQQLIGALLTRHVENTMHEVRRAIPDLSLMPVPEAVRRFVELMVASHRVEPELHRVFVEQLPRVGGYEQVEASVNEGLVLTEAYLKAHAHEIKPQNHRLTAFILVHTVEALTHSAVLMRPELLRTDAFVTELTELVVGYLQPAGRKTEPKAKRRVRASEGA
jgi:AcrR family transcriptional regulator